MAWVQTTVVAVGAELTTKAIYAYFRSRGEAVMTLVISQLGSPPSNARCPSIASFALA